MDITHLRQDWINWVPRLQTKFPRVQIPDIFPHGALWEGLVQRLSHGHDLTTSEVKEIMEELLMLHDGLGLTSQAA